MKFRQIEVFKEVMSTGTITAAAERLHVSAPAVSQMLNDFEESIDVRLFDRVKGRLSPTTEAHLLLDEINRLYGGLVELKEFVGELQEYRSRQLEIGIFPALSRQWLSKLVHEFMQEHQNITITIKEVLSPQVLEGTLKRQIDFGLSLIPIEDPSVNCELIFSWPMVCITPKGHPLSKLKSVTAKDIGDYPFIGLSDIAHSKSAIKGLFTRAGIEPQVTIQTGLMSTACHLVAQGSGVAIVDQVTAKDHSHLDICTLPLEKGFEYNVYLSKPLYGRSSDLANKFLSFLQENNINRYLQNMD